MDRNLKVTGDNPFYVSYRDVRLDGDPDLVPSESQLNVVYRWSIKRHPCLAVEVVPIADSALELDVRLSADETNAPGHPIERRKVPQTLKVTLSCNECPCGECSEKIKFQASSRGSQAASYALYETSLSIICIHPECTEEEEVIRRVDYQPPKHLQDVSLPDTSREA